MSEVNSTPDQPQRKPAKPAKPHPDFPLFPHLNGQWCKKIRGRQICFGPWRDPDAALAKFLATKDDLFAGRTPRPDTADLTVKDAANAFLNLKQARVDSGELSPLTWQKYKLTTDLIVASFGEPRLVADLRPDDFAALRNAMTRRWGSLRVRDFVQSVRSVFKHALDAGLIDRPVLFGPGFARPSNRTIRLERAARGPGMFEADELRRILDAATQPLRAMILLGCNAGLGNADIGRLPLSAVDLTRGWLTFARVKTGVPRRCPLWPETITALRDAIATRPEPKKPEHAGLVFLTKYGNAWNCDRAITHEMKKLLDRLGINGHRNFYALRHVVETIGGEAKDQVAVDAIMGHVDSSMGGHYRERISDDRLLAVVNHVRGWLFGKAEPEAAAPAEEPRILPMERTA